MALPNAYEMLLADIREIVRNEVSGIKRQEPQFFPGIDLAIYISLRKAAEELGIASQTLWTHKARIGYTKQFGQIFFKRQDLVDYMESGRPVAEKKGIMFTKYTRRK